MIPEYPIIDIPIDKPFNNDKLNREVIANRLTTLISSIKHPFVFAIDSPWGSGKTTFIKMWKQYLENQTFPTVYYNAWENDFSEDAFLSIFAELESGLKEVKNKFELKDEITESFEKAKKISFKLAKNILPAVIKTATQGLIDIKNINEEAISEAFENITKQLFEKYGASKNNRNKFRELLSDFIAKLSDTEKLKDKPLVIFIDELDRCRPTFAIEILEKTKHFFNIPGIIFILSIDKDQIQKSFKTIYGQGMMVEGYTRRFIDLEFRLPNPTNYQYIQFLISRAEVSDVFAKKLHSDLSWDYILDTFSSISNFFNLSLRDQNQLINNIILIMRMYPDKNFYHIIPIFFLTALKFNKKEIYYSFINKRITVDQLLKKLEQIDMNGTFLLSATGTRLEGYLMFFKNKSFDDPVDMSKYEEIVKNDNLTLKDKDRARKRLQIFNNLRQEGLVGVSLLNNFINKIEMLNDFVVH